MGWTRLTSDELASLLGAQDPLVLTARQNAAHAAAHTRPRTRLADDVRLQFVERVLAELADPIRSQDSFFRARTLLRQAARLMGSDPKRAQVCIRAALDSFEAHLEVGITHPTAVDTRIASAQLHLWAGIAAGLAAQDRHAADRLAAASERYHSLRDPRRAGRASEELAELHRLAGEESVATRHFAKAVAAFERADDHHRAEQARAASRGDRLRQPHCPFLTDDQSALASTILGSHEARQLRACCDIDRPSTTVSPSAAVEIAEEFRRLTDEEPSLRRAGERLHAAGAPVSDALRAVFAHDEQVATQWATDLARDGRASIAVGALAAVATPGQLAELVAGLDTDRAITALHAGIDDPVTLVSAARLFVDDEPAALAAFAAGLDPSGLDALATAAARDDQLLQALAHSDDRRCLRQALALRYDTDVDRALRLIELIGLDAAANEHRSTKQNAASFAAALAALSVDATAALRTVRRAAHLPPVKAASLLLEQGWPRQHVVNALVQGNNSRSTLLWMADVVPGDQLLTVAREAGMKASQMLDAFGPKRKAAVSRLRKLGVPDGDLQTLLESAGLGASAIDRLLNRRSTP